MDLKVLDNIANDTIKTKPPSKPRFAKIVEVNSSGMCKIKIDGEKDALDTYYPSLYSASSNDRVFIEYVGNTVVVTGSTNNHTTGGGGGTGQQGTPGKSAYEIWIDLGNKGTEADFIRAITGNDGKDGVKGDKGDKGDPGKDAVVTEMKGFYYFTIKDDGNLYVEYGNSVIPNFSIKDDGNLYIVI